MSKKLSYHLHKKPVCLFVLFIFFSCSLYSQTDSATLFVSTILTPVNSFTNGVEGPGVDAQGNLYAVNFNHQGTVGKITPAGDTSIFNELPEGSMGNGIRFNKHGDMLIADY